VVEAFARIAPAVRIPRLAFVAKRFEVEATFAKRVVVVAFEVVALRAVKFWRVVDAFARIVPAVNVPVFSFVEKRLVEDAVVAKRDVVVAFVVVALSAVKFWRVVEPVARKLPE
jgi:hypothetical protein